jgi:uncharacterized protein with PIN domain
MQRFNLAGAVRPFTRCTRCNGEVEPVAKPEVLDQLQPKTRLYYDEFARCRSCGQVYWKGTHFQHMQRVIARFADDD